MSAAGTTIVGDMAMASHSILRLIGEDGASRRGSIRNRVLLVAKLVTPARDIDVRIRDVSATGAQVEGADLPRPGSDVILKRGAFQGFARVIWSSGSNAGIQFDEPFDETELMIKLRGVPRSAEPDPGRHRRPGFSRHESHPALSDGRGWIDSIRRI
jgi:hypothetical protein